MSHAMGAVLFPDGKIKHFEYNGTIDICQPKLFDSAELVSANWRTTDWPVCSCGDNSNHHERVRIATTYGRGFSWDGFACNLCNCLLSPLEPNYDTQNEGLPDWYPALEKWLQIFRGIVG